MKRTSSGRRNVPIKALVYGPPGTGKTTFVSNAPNVTILDLEAGSSHLDVDRIEVDTFDEVVQVIRDHKSGTLAVDSLTKLEELVTDKVLGPQDKRSDGANMVNFGKGWGEGWTLAHQYWREMIAAVMRSPGNVVLVAHSMVKPWNDPTGITFDQYRPAMNDKLAQSTIKEMDYVMFAHLAHETRKAGERVIGVTGERMLQTDANAAWLAKHRGSLPESMSLDWDTFQAAVDADRGSADATVERIREAIKLVADYELQAKMSAALEEAGTNASRLERLETRVMARVNDTEKKEEKSA